MSRVEWLEAVADPDRDTVADGISGQHTEARECPTWHDGCNCTVGNLLGVRQQLMERASRFEERCAALRERVEELERLIARMRAGGVGCQ